MATRTPKVRVVVVNHNGGEMTLRCLDALRDVDWPCEYLEVLLVDNASTDGLVARVRRDLPWIRIEECERNAGFAGGCNVGLRALEDVDYVALLNNDAIPDRGWLRPLVAALEDDPDLGAANSKIVFAPSFVSLRLESPTSPAPSARRGDAPEHGVKISGLTVHDSDVWSDAQFARGCYTATTRGSGLEHTCWTAACAEVRVPVAPGRGLPEFVDVELSSDESKIVKLSSGGEPVSVTVSSKPAWFRARIEGPAFDVINNVGSSLVVGGYGADRGFLERDSGQYEHPAEVFAWCGGAVLLSRRYLDAVGVFDDRFFMYYEDTDLSWRGRLAGWRYRYVPASVVRHEHAATSGEGSVLFVHYVERNRFATLARNAPWSMVLRAAYVFLGGNLLMLARDLLGRSAGQPRLAADLARRRLLAFAAFLPMVPSMLGARVRQGVPRRRRADLVRRWMVPRVQ